MLVWMDSECSSLTSRQLKCSENYHHFLKIWKSFSRFLRRLLNISINKPINWRENFGFCYQLIRMVFLFLTAYHGNRSQSDHDNDLIFSRAFDIHISHAKPMISRVVFLKWLFTDIVHLEEFLIASKNCKWCIVHTWLVEDIGIGSKNEQSGWDQNDLATFDVSIYIFMK